MLFWEWERLESYVENNFFQISDPGKLLSPIRSVRVWRDQNLRIVMETKSAEHPMTARKQEHPPGTVRVNDDAVDFTSPGGGVARAFGVDIRKSKTHTNHQYGKHETVQTCSLHHFESNTSYKGAVAYTFDWIANVERGHYFWPDGVQESTQEISTRTLGYVTDPVTFTATSSDESGSRSCLDINVGGFRIILGSSKLATELDNTKPGYILYIGDPDEETRKRIRDSLSFALGFPIIYLGHAKHSEDFKLLSLKAINGYSMDGRAFNVPVMPPAPICTPPGSNMLDKGKVEKVVNSFFANYSSYSLSSLNWIYWHAVTAPAHMAAAYFGAAIEKIQKKYIDGQGKNFNNLIIPKQKYNALKRNIFAAIKECDLSTEDKKTFEEKINGGNVVSLKVRSQRFFDHIGLDMGSAELTAWQRRNDAAHGNELADGDYISLIRDTKLLKLILHRIVLKITVASVLYIDYYSLNFPEREVTHGVSE
ncbi:hypothetical protein C4K20_4685 [Pseudomonas chlororaphis subsp. aurantiaca]|nr:hypothetical protein C4K20_4685 [Pseudomonas chlororaphis subsp. aurantiaca]